MEVKIKKLHPNAIIPTYAHSTDAGLDLTAVSADYESDKITYNTGIAIEIPNGYVGLIFPRSSIYKKDLSLTNCVGVIDSGYRGEIKFVFRMTKDVFDAPEVYGIGDRIGQLIIIPYPKVEFKEVDNLDYSDRGEGGFGSTGK